MEPQTEENSAEVVDQEQTSPSDTKHVLTSKSFWLGLLTALAPLAPGGTDFVQQNPEAAAAIVGLLVIVARFCTKTAVTVKKQPKVVS